jgi:hypothetical protein
MRKALFLLAVVSLCVSVQAYAIGWSVDDYNTLQPIDGALITLTNNTLILSNSTDAYGEATISADTQNYFIVAVSHAGYAPYASTLNSTAASSQQVYLAPQSHQGIIRLSIVDLTLTEHKSLIYFDNGRQQGIYAVNDTITLHTNLNYTWIPAIQKVDLLVSEKGLKKYGWNYIGIGIGAMAMACLLALGILLIMVILRRKT